MNGHPSWLIAGMVSLVLAAAQAPAAEARATIEAQLLYAFNGASQPKEAAPAGIEPRLRHDFGYKSYRLLGENTARLKPGESGKLDLGHQFEITIEHKGRKKNFHVLAINLYHQGQWLLFLEVSVPQKSEPIFIKGPWTQEGLIIIALTVK